VIRLPAILFLSVAACAPADVAVVADPAAAVAGLLDQDRAFASASADTTLLDVVHTMFAPNALLAVPGRGWVQGVDAVVQAMRDNPANVGARLSWAPIRGGVSADGHHGFTFGFMTLHRSDGTTAPLKYLTYWVRDTAGWRMLAWKRRPRPAGDVPTAIMAPFVPAAGLAVSTDTVALNSFRASLVAAEQAFSDEAQRIGIGPAFAQWGRTDAVNMGGPIDTGWVVSAEAIGAAIGGGDTTTTSPVQWNADQVFVASSGDLGITFGMIRGHEGDAPPMPFFTIWARETASGEWRYIAE
jgi:hypothetical protein